MFQEKEFEDACQELNVPVVDDYEFFTESHGVKIYRQYDELQKTYLYSYKIYGLLEDVPADTCAQVYMDLDYRKKWDSYVNELVEVAPGQLYWQVNFPFPMSNRDYTYAREMKELDLDGKKVYVVLAKSAEFPSHPERKGVVRVSGYLQSMAITADESGKGTKAYMKYFDNPGGSIPTWLINYAAKTGVPGFLSQMQTACKGYPEYLKSKSS